jgi:hypothetical protein
MNETENSPILSPASPSGNEDRIESLEKLVSKLLLALTILSITFSVLLWRQARNASRNLENAKQMLAVVNNMKPVVNQLLGQLAEYGKTHPDFKPISDKYGIKEAVTAPAAAPKPTPGAAPVTAPKK